MGVNGYTGVNWSTTTKEINVAVLKASTNKDFVVKVCQTKAWSSKFICPICQCELAGYYIHRNLGLTRHWPIGTVVN